jgi:hypothetical protein
VATLVLGDAEEGGPSAATRLRTIELFAQQVVHHIEQVRLSELTARQTVRLQRLQVVGSALARSLDEREIALEVARGVSQLIPCDSVVVVHPISDASDGAPLVQARSGVDCRLPEGAARVTASSRVARTGSPCSCEPHPAAFGAHWCDALVVGGGHPVRRCSRFRCAYGLHLRAGALAVASVRRDERLQTTTPTSCSRWARSGGQRAEQRRLYAESNERARRSALRRRAGVRRVTPMGEVMRLIMRHAMSAARGEGRCVALRRDDYLHVVAVRRSGDLLAGSSSRSL